MCVFVGVSAVGSAVLVLRKAGDSSMEKIKDIDICVEQVPKSPTDRVTNSDQGCGRAEILLGHMVDW